MMTTMMLIMSIGIVLDRFINMGRHRHRSKKVEVFYTNELELDDKKFVIIHEMEGQYAIFNMTGDNKIMVKRINDSDDIVAQNKIMEILNHLQI